LKEAGEDGGDVVRRDHRHESGHPRMLSTQMAYL
jgi:hypothetical protein